GKRDDRAPGECRAEVLRQIGHRLQIDDALAIDPRGKLPTAIAGGAELDREVFELGGQHSDEVPDGHRTKNNTVTGGPLRPSYQHQLFGRNTMRLFGFVVAILVAQAFVAAPALAQARGRAFSGASSPTMVSPGVSSSMTGGIPGTLGGTAHDRQLDDRWESRHARQR